MHAPCSSFSRKGRKSHFGEKLPFSAFPEYRKEKVQFPAMSGCCSCFLTFLGALPLWAILGMTLSAVSGAMVMWGVEAMFEPFKQVIEGTKVGSHTVTAGDVGIVARRSSMQRLDASMQRLDASTSPEGVTMIRRIKPASSSTQMGASTARRRLDELDSARFSGKFP